MNYLKTIIGITVIIVLSSCVQETHLKTVYFKVDMNRQPNVSKMGIRGQFTSTPWKETIYFSDDDGDGIYEGTISQKTAQNSVSFKFVNNDDEFELQCSKNRSITFKYKPETILYETVFDNSKGTQTLINN